MPDEPDHVLVPVDDSPLADDALEYALEHYPGADITALHVVDLAEHLYAAPTAPPMPSYIETFEEYVEEQARGVLEDAAATAERHGVDITTESISGRPARAIVDYADEHDADHIVIGSHGREGVSRILLGSVAENVVRRAHCPVVVVR